MSITVESLDDARLDEWSWVVSRGFGEAPADGGGSSDQGAVLELDRCSAASESGRIVGTATAYSLEMTLPGGRSIPVGGMSDVVVLPTHRRRGVLTSMMRVQLDDGLRRGEVASILNASEAAIYGRFGYGLAQLYSVVELWRDRVAFQNSPPGVPLRMVDQGDAAGLLTSIWNHCRPARAGELSRSDSWWRCVLGKEATWKGGGDLHVVVTDDVPEAAGGYAIYTIKDRDDPHGWTVAVKELVAADALIEARLWEHLLSVDLTNKVVADARPVDDPLRWWLTDPRQYRTIELRDYLFVRILDVTTALSSRHYGAAGSLVVEVVDDFVEACGGRFRLEVDLDGTGSCERTSERPEVEMPISSLGSILLGGVSVRDLAIAGKVVELEEGAVGQADLMFSWPAAPFCQTRF